MQHEQQVARQADCVCFDVDSTVIQDEGIDVLAAFCGCYPQVADLTASAMGGGLTFRDALKARLDIIRPSLQQISACLKKNPLKLTPGIKELVDLLFHRGIDVYLVSGGFRKMIEPLAETLGIPKNCIYANRILFNEDGTYSGFDVQEPTSRAGGKPDVIRRLRQAHGYKCIVMVGDGATDMEAKPPADAFIGFGGNKIREKVRAGAAWMAYSMPEIIQVFNPSDLKVRVGVGCFVTRKGDDETVLVGKRIGSHCAGKWQLPGGHLEFFESWEACAIREVKEETGLDIEDVRFLTATNDVMIGDGKHYVTVFMRGVCKADAAPKLMEPEKCEGWEWHHYSRIPSPRMEPLDNIDADRFFPMASP